MKIIAALLVAISALLLGCGGGGSADGVTGSAGSAGSTGSTGSSPTGASSDSTGASSPSAPVSAPSAAASVSDAATTPATTVSSPAVQTKATIQGVAAMGAPMAGASISVVDATGAEVCKATAGQDGAYTCTLTVDAKSPLVVSATNGDVTYYAPLVESKSGTVNLTKLTTLLAAQLSPTGEPSSLAAQIRDGSAKVTAAALKQKTDDLHIALLPLLTNAGNDIDPISGKFSADGTGHDKALMALDVLIKPTNGKSNINVTVKTEFTIGTELPAITFVSGDKPPALPASVATSKLPATDEDTLIANFIKRLNDCYALPKSTRVSADNKKIIASTCLQLFPADDPSTYKDDGSQVGENGAFGGLFTDDGTGTTFTKPELEFRYPGDEIRLRLSVKVKGEEIFQRFRLKRYSTSYRAWGNQYKYPFWVKPWTEERKLVNRTDLSYYSTGFNVFVKNMGSEFTKVIVTPPNGFSAFELYPPIAQDFLLIKINGKQYPTNNLRLAGRYISSPGSLMGKPTSLPREIQEGLIWLDSPSGKSSDWSDSEIDKIPELTRWKADFYSGEKIIATQYYETTVAPLTIPELVRSRWAQLTDASLNEFVSNSKVTGGVNFSNGYKTYPITWTVPITDPINLYSPTIIQTQGIWASTRFNDVERVLITDRTGVVYCRNETLSDKHCQNQSYIDNVSLFFTDKRDMFYASQYWSYFIAK